MNTLYELSGAYRDFLVAVQNGDIPDEAIKATLQGLEGAIEEKADNIACIIKQLNAEINAIKAEEQALSQRRKTKENESDRLKAYLQKELEVAGMKKIETARNRISFRKSVQVDVQDENSFMKSPESENYLIYSAPKIDKTAIKEAIKAGIQVPGCQLVERQNLQIK